MPTVFSLVDGSDSESEQENTESACDHNRIESIELGG